MNNQYSVPVQKLVDSRLTKLIECADDGFSKIN